MTMTIAYAGGSQQTLKAAQDYWALGHKVVIATVLNTWGSAPRPKGSLLAIADDGRFEGSVSGGCIEGEVITRAEGILTSGKREKLTFGISQQEAQSFGLACGGTIEILLEPFSPKMKPWCDILAAISPGARPYERLINLDTLLDVKPADSQKENVFRHTFAPSDRIFVIGAVHITRALIPMAQATGHEVIIIDPRGLFTESAPFGAHVIKEWPDDTLKQARLDSSCAVITLTHDPKLDDAALDIALRSDCFYIASLGSRKTHAARLSRLEKMGHGPAALNRIHGPAGLDIGASGAEEIALSIMAELVAVKHKRQL